MSVVFENHAYGEVRFSRPYIRMLDSGGRVLLEMIVFLSFLRCRRDKKVRYVGGMGR